MLNSSYQDQSQAALNIFQELLKNTHFSKSIRPAVLISFLIQKIDEWQEAVLNQILHHPDFQCLESSWRSLHFFIFSLPVSRRIGIRVFNTTRKELIRDFEKAVDVDFSTLFKRVYEDEYGTFGGTPYSFLLADFYMKPKGQGLFLLQRLAEVASSAQAPILIGCDPETLDLNQHSEIGSIQQIERFLEGREMSGWRRFRKSEEARFVSLILPRMLLRLPYGRQQSKQYPGALNFNEESGSLSDYMWGNPAYALGQRILKSFLDYGWPARFTGAKDKAGEVTGLPVPKFESIDQEKMPVEVCIPDDFERKLETQGFISLCHIQMSSRAMFHSAITAHRPASYGTAYYSANERLASQLPHILTASRFSHYLKVILRKKIGTMEHPEQIERELNEWLSQYILDSEDASEQMKARYPLKAGSVRIVASSKLPGKFQLQVKLVPFYQLESLNAVIHLQSNLPIKT
jgi:type VI secretion system protein ImpC